MCSACHVRLRSMKSGRIMQVSGKAAATSAVTLGFKPLTVSYTQDGQFMLVGGTSNGVHMYTSEGVFVDRIVARGAWVWAAAARPGMGADMLQVAAGCEDGTISLETVVLPITYGLYEVRPLDMCQTQGLTHETLRVAFHVVHLCVLKPCTRLTDQNFECAEYVRLPRCNDGRGRAPAACSTARTHQVRRVCEERRSVWHPRRRAYSHCHHCIQPAGRRQAGVACARTHHASSSV